MGDRPQDQAPADTPTPRPARARRCRIRPSPPRQPGRGTARTRDHRPHLGRPGDRRSTPDPTGTGRPSGRGRHRSPAAGATGAPPPAGPRRPGSSGRGRKQPSQNTMVVLLSILTVGVISLVVYAFVLKPSESTVNPGAGGQTTTTIDPAAPGTTLPDDSFATYTSSTQGFRIRYPKEWAVVPVQEGELDLDAGGSDAVSVRLLQQTEVPTTQENVANIKAFTDGLVGSSKSAKILKVQGITVDGMPGYYYLYTYTDGETGAEGAHAQYFLFRGRNMYTIVFQANPSEGFTRLSKVFDQMAESFETAPDTSAAPETTTTPTTVS